MTDAHDTGRHVHDGEERGEPFGLVLSDVQVEEVLRRIAGDREGGLHEFLLTRASRMEQPQTTREEEPAAHAPKLSLSVLRALAILRFLSQHDGEQPLYDIARGVQETTSTTHRYLRTFKRISLVEQSETTRKYRLVATDIADHRPRPSTRRTVMVALSPAQIEEVLEGVVRQSRDRLRGFLIGRKGRLEQLGPLRDRDLPDDREISRSSLRALLIVRFLFLEDGVRPLYAIAPGVGLSPSTTHRYLATLKHVGLVEQIEATQEYRLATGAEA